jgi:hypothetical protein
VTVLVDHNLEGHAQRIWDVLAADGWLELLSLQRTTFQDEGLPVNADDRVIWRYAQERGMLLLTGNRNMDGVDLLEQALRDENTPTSLPVITISRTGSMRESGYPTRCDRRLVEIILCLEQYRGAGRLYIP